MTTPRKMTDEALVCFVLWCRANEARIVFNPAIARRVMDAYRRIPPTESKS